MGEATADTPKPILKIGGKPVLEHQIENLKRHSVTDIILATGHLSEIIEEYMGAGKRLGVEIAYSVEEHPMGSAGCLSLLNETLTDDFILANGDILFSLDFTRLMEFHSEKKADASLVVHPNDHPFDSDLVEVDGEDLVTDFLPKPRPDDEYHRNLVNAGVYILSPKVFDYLPEGEKKDLGGDVLPEMLADGLKLYGYNTPEYVKDMGTPKRYRQVRRDFDSGKVSAYNLGNPRPCIFLDRDGVINEYNGLVDNPEKLTLYPFAGEAIRLINDAGYLCIVVTNQPVVARGMSSIADVEVIHAKMETLLGRRGAKIDRIYWCPHHPDKGYPEENPDYKMPCDCRKPEAGMVRQAQTDFNIDMGKSFLIGDSSRDTQLAENTGLTAIGVQTGQACKDNAYPAKPEKTYKNLLEAVQKILEEKPFI